MNLILCALLLQVDLSHVPDTMATMESAEQALVRCDYARAAWIYEQCQVADPRNAGISWRLARVYVLMAEVAAGSEAERLLREAEQAGRSCIQLDSTVAEGHTWLAASLGYQALEASPANQVRLGQEVLSETARALALNPNDDVAWSIRGSTFRAIGNVGWLKKSLARIFIGGVPEGSFSDAEAALRRAVEIAPDVMRHQYELAVLYLDMGRRAEAGEILVHASKMPVRIASDAPRLKTIHRLLVEYFPEAAEGRK